MNHRSNSIRFFHLLLARFCRPSRWMIAIRVVITTVIVITIVVAISISIAIESTTTATNNNNCCDWTTNDGSKSGVS